MSIATMQSEAAIRDHLAEAERRRDGWLQRMIQSGLTPLEGRHAKMRAAECAQAVRSLAWVLGEER